MDTQRTIFVPESGGNSALETAALLNGGLGGMNGALPMMAMMNGGGFGGGMWNNPIWAIVFLAALRNGGIFGNDGNHGCTSTQLSAIQETLNSNHGQTLLMDAIKGNGTAINQLAQTLNCNQNAVVAAINSVQSAISSVGSQVGMSGLQTINAIQQGNMQIAQQLAQCCCDNKLLACQNQGALMSRIDQLANGITQGFSATAYATQQQTCDILQAGQANTQRIIDTMNQHWQADLQQRYNDARLELSQKAQNEYLVAQMKANNGCNC